MAKAPAVTPASVKPAPGAGRAKRDNSLAGRNLVVLLDGTGNELGRNLSNVLKLFRIAEKGERQLCFYNPGVGTIARASPWHRVRQKFVETTPEDWKRQIDICLYGAIHCCHMARGTLPNIEPPSRRCELPRIDQSFIVAPS